MCDKTAWLLETILLMEKPSLRVWLKNSYNDKGGSFVAFSFLGLLPKRNKKKVESKNIYDLKRQLIEVGFNPSEVDYLICMHANSRDFSNLEPEAINQIELELKNQLDIAKKCISLVKNQE